MTRLLADMNVAIVRNARDKVHSVKLAGLALVTCAKRLSHFGASPSMVETGFGR